MPLGRSVAGASVWCLAGRRVGFHEVNHPGGQAPRVRPLSLSLSLSGVPVRCPCPCP
jgi:hypothetical protein